MSAPLPRSMTRLIAVTIVLSSSAATVGLGLGLFGVLSIIRLRSTELDQHEVALASSGIEAADLIVKGMDAAISAKQVTYDFARLMEGAREVKCSEFASAVIEHMGR